MARPVDRSIPGMAKRISLLFGIVVIGFGVYSHFQSDWSTAIINKKSYKTHKIICNVTDALGLDVACPSIALEYIYLVIILVVFLLTIAQQISNYWLDWERSPHRIIDLAFHLTSAVLLVIGGALYLMSAVQIDRIEKKLEITNPEVIGLPPKLEERDYLDFRRARKFSAVFLTMLHALLYLAVGILICIRDYVLGIPTGLPGSSLSVGVTASTLNLNPKDVVMPTTKKSNQKDSMDNDAFLDDQN